MMKRFICTAILCLFILSLTACGKNERGESGSVNNTTVSDERDNQDAQDKTENQDKPDNQDADTESSKEHNTIEAG